MLPTRQTDALSHTKRRERERSGLSPEEAVRSAIRSKESVMDTDSAGQPLADPATAEPSDARAGLPTESQPPGVTATGSEVFDQALAPADQGAPARRTLKLVVSLRPGGDLGYRALLALGADGCDPLLRTVDVADLASALDELPGLLAEAEGRWQLQPRYPTAAPTKARSAAPNRTPVPSRNGPRRETSTAADEPYEGPALHPPSVPASSPPPARSSSTDQLALFG
jgi:hypothetical protein